MAKVLAIKTPAYDTDEFPKIPWGAVVRLDLFGGRLDPNFRAGKFEGEAGAEGVLNVRCDEGDIVQYGLRHKSGDREKSQNSSYYRVVAKDDGELGLGDKMDAKQAREALAEDRKNGTIHPDERARAAGSMNWIEGTYFDSAEDCTKARAQAAKNKKARAEAAAKAKADKEAAADATGEAEPGW